MLSVVNVTANATLLSHQKNAGLNLPLNHTITIIYIAINAYPTRARVKKISRTYSDDCCNAHIDA